MSDKDKAVKADTDKSTEAKATAGGPDADKQKASEKLPAPESDQPTSVTASNTAVAQPDKASTASDAGKTDQQKQKSTASSPPDKKTKPAKAAGGSGGGVWRVLSWLLVILLIGAASAGARYLWQQQQQEQLRQAQQNEQAATQMEALRNQLAASEAKLAELASEQQQLRESQTEQAQQLAQQLETVEEQLSFHSRRLRALSTTTRDDWLLAEAEYLLRLANQRLMIERTTEAAQGLLQQADEILRDLQDPQLSSVRRAIARDLTQLKLATGVDLEGLYLRLSSLAERVHELPVRYPRPPSEQEAKPDETDAVVEGDEQVSWWQRAQSALSGTFSGLKDLVRVRDHGEEPPAAILAPDAAQYLEQNLRMMLERAQLAAMREESRIYERALASAEEWVGRFYPQSQQRQNLMAEIRELADVDVQQELPDISQSLRMLTNYIDRLHRLEGVDAEEDPAEAQQ